MSFACDFESVDKIWLFLDKMDLRYRDLPQSQRHANSGKACRSFRPARPGKTGFSEMCQHLVKLLRPVALAVSKSSKALMT